MPSNPGRRPDAAPAPPVPSAPAAPLGPIRNQVRAAIERAWQRAIEAGTLPALPDDSPVIAVEIARPSHPEYGDLATNLAMKLARPYRRPPLSIAQALADELARDDAQAAGAGLVAEAGVAAPGFLNLRLADAALERTVDAILASPGAWGRVRVANPQQINVEFVSANPTGPLHIGNARGAFVGDLLCRVLEAGGHRVSREYYFNDFNAQVRNLGLSVFAVRLGRPIPADGYRGTYVEDLASEVPEALWAEATAEGADAGVLLGPWAAERCRAGIEASLERLRVRFDVWKSEGSLHREGWVDRAIDRLRATVPW